MFDSTLNVTSPSRRSLGAGAIFSAAMHAAVIVAVVYAAGRVPEMKSAAPEVVFRPLAAPAPRRPRRSAAPPKPPHRAAQEARACQSRYVCSGGYGKARRRAGDHARGAWSGEPGGQIGGEAGGQIGGTVGGQMGGTVGGTGTVISTAPPAPPPPPTNLVLPFERV